MNTLGLHDRPTCYKSWRRRVGALILSVYLSDSLPLFLHFLSLCLFLSIHLSVFLSLSTSCMCVCLIFIFFCVVLRIETRAMYTVNILYNSTALPVLNGVIIIWVWSLIIMAVWSLLSCSGSLEPCSHITGLCWSPSFLLFYHSLTFELIPAPEFPSKTTSLFTFSM